jgi:hypothetical protein
MRRELLGVIRELQKASTDTGDEGDVALGALVRELFAERVAEKREMLRRVSSGSALTRIPTDDDLVDRSPVAAEDAASLLIEVETKTAIPRRAARTRRSVLFVALGVATLAALALAIGRGGARSPSPHAPATPSAQASAAPSPAPDAAPAGPTAAPLTVAVHLETTPPGALVLLHGVQQGVTPLDLELPRSAEARDVELRHEGYATIVQHLTPDVDQKLLLTLQPAVPAADRGPPRRRRQATAAPSSSAPSSPSPATAEYPKF